MTSGKSFKVTSNLLWKVFSKAKSNGLYSIHEEVSYFVCSKCFEESLLNCLVEDTRVSLSLEMTYLITLWVKILNVEVFCIFIFSSQDSFEQNLSSLLTRNKDLFVAFRKNKAVPKFVNIAFIASKYCFWQWLIS